jgi:hypothetical protein
MRFIAVFSIAACVLGCFPGCGTPVPRLSKIERDDESGRRLVTEFSYDAAGHIVGVEKTDTPDEGDAKEETWELTWQDNGPFSGTPLVRVVYEQRLGNDVVRELDLALSRNLEARTVSAEDDETGDTATVTSKDGDIANVVAEDDSGTSTTTFNYTNGNLTSLDNERDNDEGDDTEGSLDIDYAADESLASITLKQEGAEDIVIDLAYDNDGRLDEQVLSGTLADGRDFTSIGKLGYVEGRIDSIEHRGSVDDGAEVVIGESTFRYDEGEVRGVPPTPASIFFLAPLFDLNGNSTDNISSTESESFLFPGW